MAGETEAGRLQALYHLGASLSRAKAPKDVYEAALSSVLNVTSADRAAVLIFDNDGVMRFKASRHLSLPYQAAVTGHSPWPRGTEDAQTIVVPDVREDESLAAYDDVLRREGIRAVVFVPLALDAGVFGNLILCYTEPHECPAEELEISQAIAGHVALAIERQRAERARMRSEERLQAILDKAPSVIFLKDTEGRYLLTNRRFEEVFHVDRKDVLGRTDNEIFSTAVADRLRTNDRAVIESGKPLAVEDYASHDDGIHTYAAMKFPLEEAGRLTGVCTIAMDMTERNRLEDASRHLAAIVESSDDAIVSKDLNGFITSWNKGAERLFGYTADEAIGKPVSILAAPDHRNEMPEILSKIRKGQRVEHYETRRCRKDGQIIDVALTVSPVRDASGRITGASKIARDITDRKQAEQERLLLLGRERDARRMAELLNRVGPRLAAQLDLEKLVQEVTDIATVLVGAEFGAFFHNPAVASTAPDGHTGEPHEAFAGLPMTHEADLFGPTFRGERVVRLEDVSQELSGTAERPAVRSYLAAPVIARSGEVLGGLFFGHSLPGRFTEIHEATLMGIAAQAAIAMDNARLFEHGQWIQTELKRSNEELRRVNRDLEVFAYSASHDLQEPLRTVAISAQLIQRSLGKRVSGDDATFLANIITAARRMSVLIQDLLAYTRATKYEDGVAPAVEAKNVLSTVLQDLQPAIQETGATVIAEELPIVAIHEGRLAQLFQNLIGNALKYRAQAPPRIDIKADDRDGWCVFSVTDNGIGIEPQFAEQIFGLFKRLHGRDEYPGSGIGLAICQRVVEQYGGRIWLEQSAPGQGSTFCFAIPARAAQESAIRSAADEAEKIADRHAV
jgi:PAS domain S-box-containing protein